MSYQTRQNPRISPKSQTFRFARFADQARRPAYCELSKKSSTPSLCGWDIAEIKEAVESICREVEAEGVLPIITVQTSPVGVYGGHSRRVTAAVTVEFLVPAGHLRNVIPDPEIEALRGALRGQI